MIKIKTMNKTVYLILTAFIFFMFNYSSSINTGTVLSLSDAAQNPPTKNASQLVSPSDAGTDAAQNATSNQEDSFPFILIKRMISDPTTIGGSNRRLNADLLDTSFSEINIRQGVVIINKLFDIQIFILDQITEFKDKITEIKLEYDNGLDNLNDTYLKDRLEYIPSVSQKLDALSENALEKIDLHKDAKDKIKIILGIKRKLNENIFNKESLSKYLQILRNEIIYSVLTKYLKILTDELNKDFKNFTEKDVTFIKNNLLISISILEIDTAKDTIIHKNTLFKLFIIDSDDIEFISSKIGLYKDIFEHPFISYIENSEVEYDSNREFILKKQKINSKMLLFKQNADKLFDEQTKGLNKFSKELYDLMKNLIPTLHSAGKNWPIFFYKWPKPQKEDYKDLGIAAPNFLKYQNSLVNNVFPFV